MCDLLHFFGCQLHHISPNGALHIANFITFCECYLGIAPHFDMFHYCFWVCVKSNEDAVCKFGGAILQLHPNSTFFSFDLPKSVRGWHKSWFYVEGLSDNLPAFGNEPPQKLLS